MSTTRCERGDVVLVEVVFTSQRQAKKRPALILSTEAYQTDREEVVVAAITSNLQRVRHGDTELEHWEAAGLRLPSLATAIVQTLRIGLDTARHSLRALVRDIVVETGDSEGVSEPRTRSGPTSSPSRPRLGSTLARATDRPLG